MIAVYAETNFVLEWSLEQEQSCACGEIVRLASIGAVSLLLPAFSLAEPHDAIARRATTRSRLSNELKPQLQELGRSKSLQHIPNTFSSLASILIESARSEREGLRTCIASLLHVATVIALDASILKAATTMQDQFGLSGQDSIVLASVLADLSAREPKASCFLNRNSRDFDDPDIRKELSARGCKYFASFDAGLRYLSDQLSDPDKYKLKFS